MIRIITILFLFLSTWAGAQHGMLLAKPAAGGGTSYLLDTYTGGTVALSLRLLDSDYAGNCITVQRASDNTQQAIGFSGDLLDTGTLSSFCSGTDCYVRIWYDQSGSGYSFSNTDTTEMPMIVKGGTTYNVNSLPALYFDGSDILETTGANDFNSAYSYIYVANISDNNAEQRIFDLRDNSAPGYLVLSRCYTDATNTINTFYNTSATDEVSTSFSSWGSHISVWGRAVSSGTIAVAVNGATETTTTIGATATPGADGYNVGAAEALAISQPMLGYLQEVVVWGSDKGSDKSGIESNVNTYYSIY